MDEKKTRYSKNSRLNHKLAKERAKLQLHINSGCVGDFSFYNPINKTKPDGNQTMRETVRGALNFRVNSK